MPGFSHLTSMVDRQDGDGAQRITSFRKQPAVVTTAGVWFDMSMSAGNPRPNYYASAPLIGATLSQSTAGGIFHGANVSPATKYLRNLAALSVTAGANPLPMMLCDYLLYYPFVDESTVDDPQLLDNTVTLSRYTSGAGVQIMAVVVAAHTTFGATVTCSYTNQDGVPGQTTGTHTFGAQTVNGTILTSDRARAGTVGPFFRLQQGDTGVRSIESCTVSNGGDVGLFTLVLVKPLADISLRGIDAPVEVDYLRDRPSMPPIVDDAYLNFLCYPAGSLSAAPIHGLATFTWT